ncbi:MAG: CPBP family intramembrane metalloprotease [Bacteroidales bacterium]|nr:CPBP family intramembrane metalloprotease [Bacteroidales bacterium]
MKHLERALDGQNQFWKYLVNFLAAFIGGNLVGSIPLFIVIIVKTIEAGGAITPNPDNYADLTVFGISANLSLFLMMLPLVAGLFTCIALLRPLHNRSFAEVANGTKQIRWQRVFTGFGIWFLLYTLYLGISYAFNPDNFVFQFKISTFIPLLLISIFIIPLQTTFEELMFRGYLGQGIGAWTRNRWLVMTIPALLFGLMHSANPEVKEYGFWVTMPQYILFGLVFGLTTVLDDGIEISMGVHAANNIFAALFITNKSSVLQTPAVFNQLTVDAKMETLALLFMSVVLIVALTIIYKWDFKVLNKKVDKTQIQS